MKINFNRGQIVLRYNQNAAKNLIRKLNKVAGTPMISRGSSTHTPNKLARWSEHNKSYN